jgi:hypothetical protein
MQLLRNKHHQIDPLWHVHLALLAAAVIQYFLPNRLTAFPQLLIPSLIILCMIGLQLFTPKAPVFASHLRRFVVLTLIVCVAAANISSLQLLLRAMLHATHADAPELLLSAAGIYLTNIIVFGLLYWEMDAGGPGRRRKADLKEHDFVFPQQTFDSELKHPWNATFFDYLYVSTTNATAFSPTDTLPLSRRAKFIMGIQALVSLVAVVLIAARAINIL